MTEVEILNKENELLREFYEWAKDFLGWRDFCYQHPRLVERKGGACSEVFRDPREMAVELLNKEPQGPTTFHEIEIVATEGGGEHQCIGIACFATGRLR